jgi:putative DNA primase/helicase
MTETQYSDRYSGEANSYVDPPDADHLAEIHAAIREAAITYAKQGLRVIPVRGLILGSKGDLICDCPLGAKCEKAGKHPYFKQWQNLATCDVEQVERWWDKQPTNNVGLAMGGERLAIDIDLAKSPGETSGFQELAELEELYGPLPETMTIRTGSGGLHLVFAHPAELIVGNWLPGLKGRAKRIDVRGWAGQCVAPPCIHISGNRYEWVHEVEPVEAPDWFFEKPMGQPTGAIKPASRVRSQNKSPKSKGIKSLLTTDEKKYFDELLDDVDPDAVLAPRTEELLMKGRSGDQSSVVWSIILGASAARFSPDKLFDLMQDPYAAGGKGLRTRIRDRGDDKAKDWFALTWRKALLYRTAFLVELQELRRQVDLYDWVPVVIPDGNGGKTSVRAASIKKVILAALDLANEYTNTDPMLSKLKLATITGLSPKTVRKALRALEQLDWLVLKKKGTHFNAWTYSFVLTRIRQN